MSLSQCLKASTAASIDVKCQEVRSRADIKTFHYVDGHGLSTTPRDILLPTIQLTMYYHHVSMLCHSLLVGIRYQVLGRSLVTTIFLSGTFFPLFTSSTRVVCSEWHTIPPVTSAYYLCTPDSSSTSSSINHYYYYYYYRLLKSNYF